LLAVAAGTVAFLCWLVAPFGPGSLGVSSFWPSAYLPTIEFVRWAGAGVVAGAAAACIAPRRRWIVVPPLLVALEIGWAVLVFLMVGAGDVPVPRGTLSGMCAGLLVGVAAIALCRPGLRAARRVGMIALAAAMMFVAPAISAWRGRGDLAAMREGALPAVADLLRADVLTETTPIAWIHVQRKLSREGDLYWSAYGEVACPKAQIALEWPGNRRPPAAGGFKGFGANGLQVPLAAPSSLDPIELDRRHDADEVKRALLSIGVHPALAARIVLRKQTQAANYYAVARYHGIVYDFDWRPFVSYEFRRMQFPVSSMLIKCRGTYSPVPR
jgi:hypothetical protein